MVLVKKVHGGGSVLPLTMSGFLKKLKCIDFLREVGKEVCVCVGAGGKRFVVPFT